MVLGVINAVFGLGYGLLMIIRTSLLLHACLTNATSIDDQAPPSAVPSIIETLSAATECERSLDQIIDTELQQKRISPSPNNDPMPLRGRNCYTVTTGFNNALFELETGHNLTTWECPCVAIEAW